VGGTRRKSGIYGAERTVANSGNCIVPTKSITQEESLGARKERLAVAELDTYYTLEEAAARFFPSGVVTKQSLRTEARKGRLRVTRIAGKDLVSERAIRAMLEACECPAERKAPDCSSGGGSARLDSGSSSTANVRSAQAAALRTLQALSEHSKSISSASTARPQGPRGRRMCR
jgi:hypothetical protein